MGAQWIHLISSQCLNSVVSCVSGVDNGFRWAIPAEHKRTKGPTATTEAAAAAELMAAKVKVTEPLFHHFFLFVVIAAAILPLTVVRVVEADVPGTNKNNGIVPVTNGK